MSRRADDLDLEIEGKERLRHEIGALLDEMPAHAPARNRYAEAHDRLSDELGALRRELFDLEGDASMREARQDRAFAQWTTR